MAVRILQLLIFFAVAQLGDLFPQLSVYRPFFIVAALTGIFWFVTEKSRSIESDLIALKIRKLVFLLAFCEVLPAILQLNLGLTLSIVDDWTKIALVFLFIFGLVMSKEDIKKVLFTTLLAVALIIFKAQLIYLYEPERMLFGRLGSYGMYSGANDYGLLLTCSIPLALKLTEEYQGIIRKSFLYILLCFIFIHLFLTGSRGSLLGATVVTTLSLLTRSSLSVLVRKVIACVVVLAMMVIGVTQISSIRENSKLTGGDASAEARMDAWAASGRMLLSNPLGVGFEQSRDLMLDYGMYQKMQPHNTYVKVAAEAGFLGLYAYAVALYYTISRLMRLEYYYRKIKPDKKAILIQALLFMLIGFVINTSFSQKEYDWLLYIVLSCSAKLISLESKTLRPSAV